MHVTGCTGRSDPPGTPITAGRQPSDTGVYGCTDQIEIVRVRACAGARARAHARTQLYSVHPYTLGGGRR
jgi:hypothetical protein